MVVAMVGAMRAVDEEVERGVALETGAAGQEGAATGAGGAVGEARAAVGPEAGA